jgi:hypothetical protein
MEIAAYLLSCPERQAIRSQTLQNLQDTDWNEAPRLVLDQSTASSRQERQEITAMRLMKQAVAEGSELILFLEDDLQFNRHLRHNLEGWPPLRSYQPGDFFFGSLYNPGVSELDRYPQLDFFLADPQSVYGSQAIVLSRATAEHVIAHWGEVLGMQDIKFSRLAAQRSSLFYHLPSLVQHTGVHSVWGGAFHTAGDFQVDWQSLGESRELDGVLKRITILDRMRLCQGWLEEAEAELLIAVTECAANLLPGRALGALVEVSSCCGKSSVVMALTLKGMKRSDLRVTSISPHDGQVTAVDGSLLQLRPTLEKFTQEIRICGATGWIEPVVARASQVKWDRPVALLFIDGLHDEASVAADFAHLAPWILSGGLVAFHDYGDHFPGVKRQVDELLAQGGYRLFRQVKNLVVLEKRDGDGILKAG